VNTINVIAVDGPAGSGKSTVAKQLAKRLNFLYIDTGALVDLSKTTDIKLNEEGNSIKVYLDSQDVTKAIRKMEVTKNVRSLASLKGVRANMVKIQRKLGKSHSGSVLEGRDIGTVVFPDAKHKFYLDATIDVRAERRFKELKEKGTNTTLDEVKSDVIERDKSDMTRKVGPLKKAKDAVVIDTTEMTVSEVVDTLFKITKNDK